ncbi:MAG: extracellular solute-binding protein [Oscillospiraceae bacterium]|nr:extracellular solute-binding protein [Oscillospiraceae bacterium]
MKKLIALLLALVMVFGLVACGSKADEKVELNVIAAQYGTQTADWWAGFEKDFEAANQNIDLVVDVVSWNDIYTVVNTRISNNDAPDILNIDVFADYQADGLLLPAQDYISEETYAKFYQSFLDQSVVDGTVWAVPDLASARAMYYNADILAAAGVEVPTTWDELKAACEAIKAYDPEIYPWGVDMTTDEGQACFSYYIWNNGGNFTDAEGNWTLNSAENVAAIEYIIGLVNDGLTNTDPATETRYANQDMFGAGKVAMMIGPNSIPTYLTDGGYDINWAVASIPTNNADGSVSQGVMDRFMCFDNDYSDAELAAVTTFFDFFYEDERYSEWVIMEGFLPATSAGGEIMAKADPANAAWIEIVGSSYFYPTAKAEWADVKQGVINVLQQALLGGNVQELLDTLQAEIAG